MRVPGNPAGTRNRPTRTAGLVGFGPHRVPFQDRRAGRIDLAAAEPPSGLGLPRDRRRQAAARRRAQIRLDPQRVDQRHAFDGFARQLARQDGPASACFAPSPDAGCNASTAPDAVDGSAFPKILRIRDRVARAGAEAADAPSARSAPAVPPRTVDRSSRTESWRRDHARRRARQIRQPAHWRVSKILGVAIHRELSGNPTALRSPCCVQSEQAQDGPAQLRQFGSPRCRG